MTMVIPAATGGGLTGGFATCRVLVVEPFISNRRLLHDMLSDLGVAGSDECGNVAEAWKRLDDGRYNVLFLDWSNSTDAVGFLRALRRRDNPHRFLPVVVMTGYGDLDHVAAARDCGTTEFMLKPFSLQVVASRLRSITQHPRLFIAAGNFFGPDRRRRRAEWEGPERRHHANWRSADRRRDTRPWPGPERRQGRPGFASLERRGADRTHH